MTARRLVYAAVGLAAAGWFLFAWLNSQYPILFLLLSMAWFWLVFAARAPKKS